MKKAEKTEGRRRVVRLGGAKLATNGFLDKKEPEEPVRMYDPEG